MKESRVGLSELTFHTRESLVVLSELLNRMRLLLVVLLFPVWLSIVVYTAKLLKAVSLGMVLSVEI